MRTVFEVGVALAEIRGARLYRETHPTFEAYLDGRWGMSRSYAYRQIDAARVVELVSPMGDTPANERQARELVPLLDEPDVLRAAWSEASAGGSPTAEKVKMAVDRARASTSARPDWRTPIFDALAADARAHRRTHATHDALEDALLAAFHAGHGERELRELLRQGGSEPTPRRLREWLDDAERREREGAVL